MYRFIIVILLICSFQPEHAVAQNMQTAHQELRTLLHGIEDAVNNGEYSKLKQYFSDDMKVTTINQEVLSAPSEIAPYFKKWIGKGGYLKKIEMTLHADEKTKFYNNHFGVVWGWGEEKYLLSDTRSFDMKTRWTATVIKESDGKWRILTLHIGTNFLDNPVINAIESSTKTFVAIGTGAGLALGLVLGFFIRRKKSACFIR